MKRILSSIVQIVLVAAGISAAVPSPESVFRNPPEAAKPIIIWQWMDGMVTREGITADLEAYKAAGIGGVQQFLVGGPMQTLVSDTTNAIGTDNWRELMRFAMDECARLGLSFGTHNCPGWSSSAFPTVKPEDSMQKLVWSDTVVVVNAPTGKRASAVPLKLVRPEVDAKWDYYKDIAVVAVPDTGRYAVSDAVVLTDRLSPDGSFTVELPDGLWKVYRFGHTTNGKTNSATAPAGGRGLECDKMSRRALEKYWEGYPSMLLDIAGEHAGKTFTRIEIDSYEAGGQDWTPLMAEEFSSMKGYDLLPWLPVLAGQHTSLPDDEKKFNSDWEDCVRELFAVNYYGHMSTLIRRVPGMRLLAQPYGTGGAKPFNPIHTSKIVNAIDEDDIVCTEFWVRPGWGWKDIPRVTSAAYQKGHGIIFAEGFTCWPLHAWKDDPASLKAVADRSFCMGINSLMLHAGAQNPWVGHLPGMTFGKWGTQWSPGQTWWISGGAAELFTYMARCQALLQRGDYVDDFVSGISLTSDYADLQWIHRRQGTTDIYFLSNPNDSAVTVNVSLPVADRVPELWFPDSGEWSEAETWTLNGGMATIRIDMVENEALFVLFRNYNADMSAPGIGEKSPAKTRIIPVKGAWTLSFPEGWGAPASISMDNLVSWHEHPDSGVKYFSGTATYSKTVKLGKVKPGKRYLLRLGDVKNLARVRVNGTEVAHLWKKPFEVDVTSHLNDGGNLLEVDVTNLWVNRMVGDEQYPDDIDWDEPFVYEYAPGSPVVGSFMKSVPDWLVNNTPRPVSERKTVVSFKYFQKDSPLLPSGLLGPVEIHVMD